MDKNQEIQLLGTQRISKLLLKFSIPCVMGLLIGALYNIVDQIFIGSGGDSVLNPVFFYKIKEVMQMRRGI